jgi:hypothetical protein
MNTVDQVRRASVCLRGPTILISLFLAGFGFGAGGCADEYGPAYGPGYYSRAGYPPSYGYGPYGPGYRYGPGYGAVAIEVGDRPYYTRGPGYWAGRSYYVWRPGHWRTRNGHRVWIHGHYVLRS